MASSASYPRKYYSVSYAELNTIPLVEGNVIATYDTDGFYYDVGNPAGSGENVVRRQASSIEFVGDTLPESRHEPTTIFVVHTGDSTDENGNPISLYSGYKWNDTQEVLAFEEVFNNLRDFKVKSDVITEDTRAYIVGSISQASDIGTLLKSSAYIAADGKLHGDLAGVADRAESADNAMIATNADYAEYDYDSKNSSYTPKKINGYIRELSSDVQEHIGTTITFTRGDGTSDSVNTRDTRYEVFNNSQSNPISDSDGRLVPKISITTLSDNTNLLLSGSGWINKSNIVMPSADSANKDGLGQNIAATYVKSASYNSSTDELTLTYGDNTTSAPIPIPDTTYEVFTTNTNGLVPGPTSQQATMFLKANGWSALPVFAGSDSGLVPTAAATDATKYLRGDGTWGTTFAQGTAGLVPGPATADPTMSLKANGQWTADTDTMNTAGATNDTSNKLFIIGARAQSANPQTYSNQNVYIQNNKIYSSGAELVDTSSAQTLSNKSFSINGEDYPIGDACGANRTDTISPEITDDATFSGDGSTTVFEFDDDLHISSIIAVTVNDTPLSNTDYSLDDTQTPNQITFVTAPASGTDNIDVTFVADNPSYVSDDVPTNDAVVTYVENQITDVSNKIADKADTSMVAPGYDDTATYTVGSFCTNQTQDAVKLYKCDTAVTVAESFDPSKWSEVSVTDEIEQINIKVPTPPSTNGTYYLSVTVNNGIKTYSWVTLT